jgi:hypothetical protein
LSETEKHLELDFERIVFYANFKITISVVRGNRHSPLSVQRGGHRLGAFRLDYLRPLSQTT